MKIKDNTKNIRFWGWGLKDHFFDRSKAKAFLNYLKGYYRLKKLNTETFEPDYDSYMAPASKLPEAFIRYWSTRGLTIDPKERLLHALGKSYRDLVRVRSAKIPRYPDGVLYLSKEEEIARLYEDAQQYEITLIPFGGGTGVVGGTECIGLKDTPTLVVDLKQMNSMIQIDKLAQTARFQAGILGPKLEEILNNKGFTLGHFPQSFEFSTLGGWVATRSAGQNSTKYGKIEDRVQSLTIYSPKGVIQTSSTPASATGPSLKQLMIGSEGVYGMITDVTVRIAPLPETCKFVPGFFKRFKDGIHCIREMMQEGLKPSIVRLSDTVETEMFMQISLTSALKKMLVPLWMKYKKLGERPCFFLIAAEGFKPEVRYHSSAIKKMIQKHDGAVLGTAYEKKWKRDRFELPYLRDDLLDHGFFIDTLETAAPWSQLQKIYLEMMRAFEHREAEERLIVGCHLSHCYSDGASLYFTFIGLQQKGAELEQWEEIKEIATDVIMTHGGALSHHHGIGYDHKKWMKQEKSALGLDVLKEVKGQLDPKGLLNPGKVF